MSITDLYSNFAEPYGLWDCQLAILHCAGHPDSMLIATVWDEIISRYVKTKQTRLSPPFEQILWNLIGIPIFVLDFREISRTAEMAPQDRTRAMAIKIQQMGKMYANSQKYFPLG